MKLSTNALDSFAAMQHITQMFNLTKPISVRIVPSSLKMRVDSTKNKKRRNFIYFFRLAKYVRFASEMSGLRIGEYFSS